VNEPSEKPSPDRAARRKLVRGAFSVPAVMTLVSGSPAAATSLVCALKPRPDTPLDGVGTSDMNLVRIPYFKSQNTWGTYANKFYIKGSDLHAKKFPGRSVTGSGLVNSTGWQEVRFVEGKPVPGVLAAGNPNLSGTASGHVIVRYDELGDIVGFAKSDSGTAMGASCWVSAIAAH